MSVNTQPAMTAFVDGYKLEALLGDGAFSWVYRAVSEDGSQVRAIKIAKPDGYVSDPNKGDWEKSQALRFTTGGVAGVVPDSEQLLAFQAEKMQAVGDPVFPLIDQFVMTGDKCYCRMELVSGRTLREVMAAGEVAMSQMVEVLRALQRLEDHPKFQYHGDLKPENILLSSDRVRLIDPGYFGPLDCADGAAASCVVSTPAYYPMLRPDDLFAMGLILWEVVCGVHPLAGGGQEEMSAGEELRKFVRQKELVGQYFLTPLLRMSRPSVTVRGMDQRLEQFLLKALRLKTIAENRFELSDGFSSFASMADALRDATGI